MNLQEQDIDLGKLLEVLRNHKGRALHVMEVCARLGVPNKERDAVRAALDTLSEEQLVQELPGLRYRATKARHQLGRQPGPPAPPPQKELPRRGASFEGGRRVAPSAKVGVLRIHARGHGFVIPEDKSDDVFVAPQELLGALHGDRVAVSVRRGERGLDGTIVAVLARGIKYVAGLLSQDGRGLVITPNDARLPRRVHVVDRVPGDAVPGIEVVGEIVRFFEDGSPPEARVVRVLGVEGSAEVEVAKVKLREGIREEFPPEVLAEAQAFGDRVTAKDRKGREDLRDLDLVTIDPLTARDHDDALYIERLPRGRGYRVVVAIADVSHYVQEGSAIDKEALERCTSIYLPDRAIPMLPPELSSNLASLVAGKDRLTLALDIDLSPDGVVRSFRYVEGVMKCKAGLTYEGVADALGLSKHGRPERAAVKLKPMLEIMYEAAMTLRSRRMKRGSMDFDLPEAFVELDDKGEPKDVTRSRKDPGIRKAYQIVEEMMLLANETVATDLAMRKMPAIYRVHGLPDEDRLEQFAGLAKALGHNFDPDDVTSPKELSRFLQSLEDTPHKSSLSYLLLRAMQQASYDTVNVGHFGLAATYYLHFTSPIRRYPDTAVHRVVRKLARDEPVDVSGLERKLREQAQASSKLERRAMLVEREIKDVYRCILVKPRVGDEFEATVTGVAPHGVYVSFDEPFVEALCHVSALGNDFYEIDQHGLRLVGRRSGASYGLGDRLTVRLESVNVAERSILAAPVVYVHPDELGDSERRALDPVHEGGSARLKRRNDGRSRWGSHVPPRATESERPAAGRERRREGKSTRSDQTERFERGGEGKRTRSDQTERFERRDVRASQSQSPGQGQGQGARRDKRFVSDDERRERRRERRSGDERKQQKRKKRR
jgi:ribonuclease R